MGWLGLCFIAPIALGTAGCSLALSHDNVQCRSDTDCNGFADHPICDVDNNVCIPSGLGPPGCVFDSLSSQGDFLNACSTSKYLAYPNCDRIMYCNGQPALPAAATMPMTMKSTTPVNPVEEPMNLCTDGAPGPAGGPPNMIYLFGTADFGPLLRATQLALYALPIQYRAVFQGSTSCNGVTSVFNPVMRTMKDPTTPTGAWSFYYDTSGKQVNCRLDAKNATTPVGAPIDIGVSNLYAQTCDPALSPGAGVTEYTATVVPFVLAVPFASSENAISAEAAHLVFGLGGTPPQNSGMKAAAPWTDWTTYYIRNSNAGSTILTALLIDVPRGRFWGIDTLSTENLRDSLLAAPSSASSSAIGILSIDFYDKNRGNLKALFLQAKGQNYGYLPDSSATTVDKVNVRDGHYPLWGYVHLFTAAPDGVARNFIVALTSQRVDQGLLDNIIQASQVPQCAMKVQRSSEMGDFLKRNGFSCGCYFDFKTKMKTSCTQCVTSEDCPGSAPSCNYGYCEQQ